MFGLLVDNVDGRESFPRDLTDAFAKLSAAKHLISVDKELPHGLVVFG